MENEVKQWVKRPELQDIVKECGYSAYQKESDANKYQQLEGFINQYQQWFNDRGYKQNRRGLHIAQGEYEFSLVMIGGQPLYIMVKQPLVTYRVNIYPETQEYTVDIEERVRETVKNRAYRVLGLSL